MKHLNEDFEPHHASSPTEALLNELQLHGHARFDDGPDTRPLPDPKTAHGALYDIFDALVAALEDTRLEDDLQSLLWGQVNLFHRGIDRIQRLLDDNEAAQRTSQREQDGSEIKSVDLEKLLAEGLTLVERRNCMEWMRDTAAEHYEEATGIAWRPMAGSMVNRAKMTSAMIDSRDFLQAQAYTKNTVLLPPGPKVAFTGGTTFENHTAIWDKLDKVLARHPGMVLMHGGSTKGADKIASLWADSRKIAQIAFKPDFARHDKAAGFKRNDAMLETHPIGLVAFPGSGVNANMVDKARKAKIPVF
jgi:hypothetical protein